MVTVIEGLGISHQGGLEDSLLLQQLRQGKVWLSEVFEVPTYELRGTFRGDPHVWNGHFRKTSVPHVWNGVN